MSIYGFKGFNKTDGTEVLLVGYGNDIVNGTTQLGYQQNISSTNNQEMETFLDNVFWQNYSDPPRTFDGTNWSKSTYVDDCTPLSKYIIAYQNKLYLANLKINVPTYGVITWPSRVWYSDLPKKNTIKWDISFGNDLAQTYESAVVTSASGKFNTRGIKTGDTFYILSGANAGQYEVNSVDKDTQITLTQKLWNTASSSQYWVGGNYFDVETDNDDFISGVGVNSGKLLFFKQDSLHRYDISSLKQVKDVPGTTSHRSIVNIGGYTVYFHGGLKDESGFYLYDGVTSQHITKPIQPYIDGIASADFDNVVAWKEGKEYRAFVGDLSNTNSNNNSYNISRTKAVFSFYVPNLTWEVGSIPDTIVATAYWRQSNLLKTYIASSNEVFRTPYGNSFDNNPINSIIETRVIYPRGIGVVNIMTRVKIISRDAYGVHLDYKLWNYPYEVDDQYRGLGDLKDDVTEMTIPASHGRSAGIQLRFIDSSTMEPRFKIEKLIIYSYGETEENPEQENQ